MSLDTQLKLQSFLDGELPPDEAREIAVLVQQDLGAAALLAELKNTRVAIQSAGVSATVPATREFYWSKIKQEIEQLDDQPARRREPGLLARLRFLILPAAATVVLIILGLAVRNHVRPFTPSKSTVGSPTTTDTALANTGTNGNIPR